MSRQLALPILIAAMKICGNNSSLTSILCVVIVSKSAKCMSDKVTYFFEASRSKPRTAARSNEESYRLCYWIRQLRTQYVGYVSFQSLFCAGRRNSFATSCWRRINYAWPTDSTSTSWPTRCLLGMSELRGWPETTRTRRPELHSSQFYRCVLFSVHPIYSKRCDWLNK